MQPLAALAVERGDALAQPGDRGGQIVALGGRASVSRVFDLVGFGLGDEIDRPHRVALARQAIEPAPVASASVGQLLVRVDADRGEDCIGLAFEPLGDAPAPASVALRLVGLVALALGSARAPRARGRAPARRRLAALLRLGETGLARRPARRRPGCVARRIGDGLGERLALVRRSRPARVPAPRSRHSDVAARSSSVGALARRRHRARCGHESSSRRCAAQPLRARLLPRAAAGRARPGAPAAGAALGERAAHAPAAASRASAGSGSSASASARLGFVRSRLGQVERSGAAPPLQRGAARGDGGGGARQLGLAVARLGQLAHGLARGLARGALASRRGRGSARCGIVQRDSRCVAASASAPDSSPRSRRGGCVVQPLGRGVGGPATRRKPSQRHKPPSRLTRRWPGREPRLQPLAIGCVGDHADLLQAAGQRGGRGDMRRQRRGAAGQPGALGVIGERVPVRRRRRSSSGAVRSSPSAAPSAASKPCATCNAVEDRRPAPVARPRRAARPAPAPRR